VRTVAIVVPNTYLEFLSENVLHSLHVVTDLSHDIPSLIASLQPETTRYAQTVYVLVSMKKRLTVQRHINCAISQGKVDLSESTLCLYTFVYRPK
jgi:hypothetical protein